MKHVKLSEDFGQGVQTLPPADISKRGETVLYFGIGDDSHVALLPTNEIESFMMRVNEIFEAENIESESRSGVAYVLFGPRPGGRAFEKYGVYFEDASFESETPKSLHWITGEDTDGYNPNDPDEEFPSIVYTLKRGKVISVSPESGPPLIQEFTPEEFIQYLKGSLR